MSQPRMVRHFHPQRSEPARPYIPQRGGEMASKDSGPGLKVPGDATQLLKAAQRSRKSLALGPDSTGSS